MSKLFPMTSLTPEEIAQSVRPALTKLYVLYFRIANQSDLTGPQLTILGRLAEDGESRISHVAQAEGIQMPTASNALHQLEQRGMVYRIPDENDRRGVRVGLTHMGHREFQRVGHERDQYIATMLATLPPEDLEKARVAAEVINRLVETYPQALKQEH